MLAIRRRQNTARYRQSSVSESHQALSSFQRSQRIGNRRNVTWPTGHFFQPLTKLPVNQWVSRLRCRIKSPLPPNQQWYFYLNSFRGSNPRNAAALPSPFHRRCLQDHSRFLQKFIHMQTPAASEPHVRLIIDSTGVSRLLDISRDAYRAGGSEYVFWPASPTFCCKNLKPASRLKCTAGRNRRSSNCLRYKLFRNQC